MALDRRPWHRALALGASTAIAVPALHHTLFPWRLGFGVPVLEEAEGQRGPALAGYVAVLYLWGVSGVAATRRLPTSSRPWTLAGMAVAVAFRQLAVSHLAWIRRRREGTLDGGIAHGRHERRCFVLLRDRRWSPSISDATDGVPERRAG